MADTPKLRSIAVPANLDKKSSPGMVWLIISYDHFDRCDIFSFPINPQISLQFYMLN